MTRGAPTPPPASGRRFALGCELAFVIGLKLVALVVLYLLFFSPAHRAAIDTPAHIAGSAITQPR
jgi:hypothetical protein